MYLKFEKYQELLHEQQVNANIYHNIKRQTIWYFTFLWKIYMHCIYAKESLKMTTCAKPLQHYFSKRLCKKCPYLEFFLSVISRIWTEKLWIRKRFTQSKCLKKLAVKGQMLIFWWWIPQWDTPQKWSFRLSRLFRTLNSLLRYLVDFITFSKANLQETQLTFVRCQ